MESKSRFSRMIQQARLQKGWSQADLAARLPPVRSDSPPSRTYVAGLEQGTLPPPLRDGCAAFASVLGIAEDALWEAAAEDLWGRINPDLRQFIEDRIRKAAGIGEDAVAIALLAELRDRSQAADEAPILITGYRDLIRACREVSLLGPVIPLDEHWNAALDEHSGRDGEQVLELLLEALRRVDPWETVLELALLLGRLHAKERRETVAAPNENQHPAPNLPKDE